MNEEMQDIELDDIDIDEIAYEEKPLSEWQEELTVPLPQLPCNSHIIMQCIVNLANKYQIAYNAYNTLMVLCDRAEKQFKAEKYKLVGDFLADCKKKNIKAPAKESVEAIVINKDENRRVRALMDRYNIYSMIKDFFENHKTKLEKTMTVARDLSYSVQSNSRVEYKGNV